jgi:hypothetical protein
MKLEAKELRIGNIVINAGRRDSVQPLIGVESVSVSLLGIIATYPDNHEYEPVPLTEEWLIKFGFVFDGFRYQQEINNNLWVLVKNNVYGWYSPHIEISNGIQNVHQLQNLYFALTGEELKTTL